MKTLDIYIGGDICPTVKNEHFFISGEIDKFLEKKIIEKLKNSDCNIFNFETTMSNKSNPIKKCGPNLICSPNCINGLKKLQPSVIGLANNHSLDHGAEALLNTIRIFRQNEIEIVGAGKNLYEASLPYVLEKYGYKIGVYTCAEHEFTIAGQKEAGANPFDALYSFDHIYELKQKCDFVIVLYHGGKEFYQYPSPEVQRICRRMIEKGADVVVTQHTHCIGCREDYLSGVIIYGQGNFIFDQGEILNDETLSLTTSMLLLHIAIKNKNIAVEEIPLVLKQGIVKIPDEALYNKIMSEYHARGKAIKKELFLEKQYGKFADKMINSYLHWFIIGNNIFLRIANRLLNRKLTSLLMNEKRYLAFRNFIECEAHRELLLEGINNKIFNK